MTKKILTLLAMMSIAAMMMLSSCTAAGVECGLIGVWELEDNKNYTIEITSDDKLIERDNTTKTIAEGEIIKVTDKKITYEVTIYGSLKKEFSFEYSDLGCDSVKFNGEKYKKVY